jgi:SulP family sulfate permease
MPFFGGIAATGAIARTATNIRYGAHSPFAAVFHSIFTVAAVVALAPLMGHIPMATLAALLLLVAYNMADIEHFGHIVKVAQTGDVLVLLICFGLTALVDMVAGVTVGVALASLIFMRRMANITSASVMTGDQTLERFGRLPDEILVYDIKGPLFFGAAQKAAETLGALSDKHTKVVFVLQDVPVMDTTGLVALESAIIFLRENGKAVYLCGLSPQPASLISRSVSLRAGDDYTIIKSLSEVALLHETETPA